MATSRRGIRVRTGSPSAVAATSRNSSVAQQPTLLGWQRLIQRFGGLGDGAADPAGPAVALDSERAALATLPGLATRRATAAAARPAHPSPPHQHVDQARLQQQPGLPAGPSMAARSSSSPIGPSRYRPTSTSRANPACSVRSPSRSARIATITGWRAAWAATASKNAARSTGPGTAPSLPRTGRPPAPVRLDIGQRRQRRGCPGVITVTTRPLALQGGGHPGAHQRRLAAARRPDDRQQARRGQPPDAFGDLAHRGRRTRRHHRRRRGPARDRGTRRWVADLPSTPCRPGSCTQDRPLQRRPAPGRGSTPTGRPARCGPGASCAAPRPGGQPGTEPAPAAPAPLPQRGLRDPCLTSAQHLPMAPGSQLRRPTLLLRRQGAAPPAGPPRSAPAPSPRSSASARPRHNANASAEHVRRPIRLTAGEQLPAPANQPLETVGVHLVGRAPSTGSRAGSSRSPRPPTPCRSRITHPGTTLFHDAGGASPHNASASRSLPTASPGRNGQHRQHHPIPRPQRTITVHRHRTQQPMPIARSLRPPPTAVNRADNPLIPTTVSTILPGGRRVRRLPTTIQLRMVIAPADQHRALSEDPSSHVLEGEDLGYGDLGGPRPDEVAPVSRRTGRTRPSRSPHLAARAAGLGGAKPYDCSDSRDGHAHRMTGEVRAETVR